MGWVFDGAMVVVVAAILAAPAVLYKYVLKDKSNVPDGVKNVGRWLMDNFISTSLLLLVFSATLYMYGRNRNMVALGFGLVVCVLIVTYQAGYLGIEKLNEKAAAASVGVAQAGTKLAPWQMYLLSGVFVLVSVYLIRKIFMRRVMLGGVLLGGNELAEDEEDDAPVPLSEIDYEDMDGGMSPAEREDVQDDIYEGGNPSENLDELDNFSEDEERELMSAAIGGANKTFNDQIKRLAADYD